ncbi:hypothetical protein H310_05981 [Aphanomyces invadans]|uniref:Uncharacterized protein n=1 Tax=Aphanomyces invadans TaxID=157072 RepID=A0A024U8F6_9STRA|nr:hypothetical protein H310_05981 [Aphanomyces invadans]ETW02480.1 hypothetical protein H310_05981 [Aphanomyces invadans]|eukprot:XP_008869085.1 hypothetical protein H310_05981 [Aphanomyces invadans]
MTKHFSWTTGSWDDMGWEVVWYLYTAIVLAMLYFAYPTLAKIPLFFSKEYKMVDAASNGQLDTVRSLLAQGANVDWTMSEIMGDPLTAVYWASINGDVKVVELLLEQHANPNIATKSGYTALTAAAELGDATIAKLLLDNHAEVDHADKAGETPLMRATSGGHTAVVKLLLAHEAQVDLADKLNGNTALMIAAWHGHLEIVKLLCHHANVALVNNDGKTARDLALDAGRRECAHFLLTQARGQDLKHRTHTAQKDG